MNTALNRDGTYRVPSHISFNSLPFSGEAEDAQSSASFFLGAAGGVGSRDESGRGLSAVKIPDTLERRKCKGVSCETGSGGSRRQFSERD